MKIAVAGTGYVGLSIATLLAQHNTVTVVDIIPEKVKLINNKNHLFRMIILRSTLLKRNLISQQLLMLNQHIRMLIL